MKQKYCLPFVGLFLSFLTILLNFSVIFAQSNSVLSLSLTSIGSSSVSPNIIFLETKELRPTFKGTAPANSSVTVEIEGNKNNTKAGGDGQWSWTPLQDLKLGEAELKISSGIQSKLFRLKVLSNLKALDSGEPSATREANPVSSPKSIFEQDQAAVNQPSSSPVESTSAPREAGFLATLQNYLPFILGAFAIGILLFIISRLFKPSPSVPPSPSGGPPSPPPASSPELTPTSIPTSENIPPPPPPPPTTPPTWQPPVPETIATPTAPSQATPTPPAETSVPPSPPGPPSSSTQEQN